MVGIFPGLVTSILGHSRDIVPYYDLIDVLFLQKKIGLSISHLVPKIFEPKVDLIFHQNVLFNSF